MSLKASQQFVWKRIKDHSAFFVLYPMVVLLLIVLGWPFYQAFEENRLESIRQTEYSFLNVTEHIFLKEFQERIGDILVLSHSHALKHLVNDGRSEDREAFEQSLVNFANSYLCYDQVRLLDLKGRELIRVNLKEDGAVTVPKAELQDKSHREYFKQAALLERGQVYVSRMDLNIENNQIERPFKPVIRFATPVFDMEGKKAGTLVLNYLAGDMLGAYRRALKKNSSHQGMLIDSQGYWLSNHDRSNEWGFMLDRDDLVFSSYYPKAWNAISKQSEGFFTTDEGLFLFETITPLALDSDMLPHLLAPHSLQLSDEKAQSYSWKSVIFVPREVLASGGLLNVPFLKVVMLASLLMLAIILWIFVGWRHRLHAEIEIVRKKHDDLHDRYQNSPTGDITFDQNWRLIEANQTALDWSGYQRKQIQHVHISKFLTESSYARFVSALPAFEKAEGFNDKQFHFKSASGGRVPLSMSARLIRDKEGGENYWRCTLFNIVERLQLERELETQAHYDPLTNVPNRRWFLDLARRELSRANRQHTSFCVMMMDIDHFKNVNDAFGHDAGDEVLKGLATRAASILRREDLFARFGGEEFVALLPGSNLEKAVDVAERIREYIAATGIRLNTGKVISVTISIGVAMYRTGDSLDDLIKRADTALYEAKERGRDLVCSEDFDTSGQDRVPELV